MSLPTQVSPPYSHQSQGAVERFHKTLWSSQSHQDRACRSARTSLRSCRRVTSTLDSHAVFQINRYLVRSDGRTSFEGVQQTAEVTRRSFQRACSRSHSGSTPFSKILTFRVSPLLKIADQINPSKLTRALVRKGKKVSETAEMLNMLNFWGFLELIGLSSL